MRRPVICPCKPVSSAIEMSSVATPTASPSMLIADRNAVCRCLRAAHR